MSQPFSTTRDDADFIPAAAVHESIAIADRELSELERALEEALVRAEDLEAQVIEDGMDADTLAWMMVQMQHFFDGLREQADRESLPCSRSRRTREHAGCGRRTPGPNGAGVNRRPRGRPRVRELCSLERADAIAAAASIDSGVVRPLAPDRSARGRTERQAPAGSPSVSNLYAPDTGDIVDGSASPSDDGLASNAAVVVDAPNETPVTSGGLVDLSTRGGTGPTPDGSSGAPAGHALEPVAVVVAPTPRG